METLIGRWEPVYRSQLHYLVSWSTRDRRALLRDGHARTLRRLVEQVCEERGHTLLEVSAGADHVHLLMALRPTHSVSSVVRELKSRTGVLLLSRFPELRAWLRGSLLWDERYTVETVSAVRVEGVRDRLRALHAPDEILATGS
jgi:putative transposase